VDTFRFTGNADPSVVTTVWFPEAVYGSAAVGFEIRPSCSLRLYLLDDAQTEALNASGTLPALSSALTCDRTEGLYQGKIRALAFENVGTVTLPYAVQTTLFVAAFPYAFLVLPGALLAIAGVIPLVARMMIGSIEKIAEEYSRDRTLNDRNEEKSDKKR
jgi:hypothetical protein